MEPLLFQAEPTSEGPFLCQTQIFGIWDVSGMWVPCIKITTELRKQFSGDLNNKNIWITNFHLYGIQMSSNQMVVQYLDPHSNTGLVFKCWSQYQTKFSPAFKWHSNTGLLGNRTTFDNLNNWLVPYSDPHCTGDYLYVPGQRCKDEGWLSRGLCLAGSWKMHYLINMQNLTWSSYQGKSKL